MSFTSKTLFSNRGKLNPEEGNVSDTYCAYDHLHLYAVVCNNISKFCTPGFFPPTIIAASSKSHYIYNETAAHQKSLSRQNCKIYDVRE